MEYISLPLIINAIMIGKTSQLFTIQKMVIFHEKEYRILILGFSSYLKKKQEKT